MEAEATRRAGSGRAASGRVGSAGASPAARPLRAAAGRRAASPVAEESGFALLVALLTLVGLTALASAGFLLSDAEYDVNRSHQASVRAFYAANSGLAEYMAKGRVQADTQWVDVPEGQARITARTLLAPDPRSRLYLVESTGFHEDGTVGQATRTVSVVAIHKAADIFPTAAVVAATGMHKNGNSGTLSGFDSATPAECLGGGTTHLAGLVVPPGGYSGKTKPLEGDPPLDDSQEAEALLEEVGIDWAAVLDGSLVTPDYVYPDEPFPDFDSEVEPDEWPVILIEGDFAGKLPDGRGTIVATDDVTLNGAQSWRGLILIGGAFTSNGIQTVRGAMIVGLNVQLGESVDDSSLGNGTMDYRYHSCDVLAALRAFGSLSDEPGTWLESM